MPSLRSAAGFTLIELLVVIAIIGVLSAVSMNYLSTARDRGRDAAIRSALTSARSQAELFYAANDGLYVGAANVCAQNAVVDGVRGVYQFAESAAESAGGVTINTTLGTAGSVTRVTCRATPNAAGNNPRNGWAMEAPLRAAGTNAMLCVDSSGLSVVNTGSRLAANDASCL